MPTGKMYLGSTQVSSGSLDPDIYVRPADWLALPAVAAGQHKFVGLHAVYDDDANFLAFNCGGHYTVDWGDGSAPENVSQNTSAYHKYVYSAVSSSTLSSRGYRQVIVTITPQAGSSFTKVDLYVNHNQAGLTTGRSSGWLDIRMVGSLLTSLTIGSSGSNVRHRMLEQFEYVGPNAITTCLGKFQQCAALQSIVSFDTTTSLSFASMFSACTALRSIPLLNTAAGTNFSSMFAGCSALRTVPLLDTTAGTLFSAMFLNCTALQTIPLLAMASGTDFAGTFSGCGSLRNLPALNMGACTTAAGMGTTFSTTTSLATCAVVGIKFSVVFPAAQLGPAALDQIYTNLASGVTAQTITVTNNWGTSADTPSIATAKGWTVTG